MKKIFGVQAEFNITADEDITKGIGKGLSNGSILFKDIVKEIKPEIIKALKKCFVEEKSKKGKKNEKHNSNR